MILVFKGYPIGLLCHDCLCYPIGMKLIHIDYQLVYKYFAKQCIVRFCRTNISKIVQDLSINKSDGLKFFLCRFLLLAIFFFCLFFHFVLMSIIKRNIIIVNYKF